MMSTAAKTLPPVPANKRVDGKPLIRPPLATPRLRLSGKHTVHWFRKGLRLHDNPALREGLLGACTFRCIFIIDPWFASSSNVGINKWRFLLQSLDDLDQNLRKLNSRLFVIRGQPADALPKLFREWGTTALTFEEDPEPYGRVRDHNIVTKCHEVGINVVSRVSHTLYQLDKIIELNGGKAPLTYHQFQALVASMPPPPPPEPTICKQSLHGATTPLGDDHDDRFGVPTLEELGFETEGLKAPVWLGGEKEALIRLERHLERKAWVASFGRPKMTPQSLLASQTGLSPYLRFGCLSTRLFYYQLTELYKRVKQVRPPLSLHGQLLWREFFYCAATRNPNFDRMEGNPICVQIPWEKNQDALAKWANGQTGYPWIDAIMIQLREEGWIHQLARHAVACFLTRGDLWLSWEEGMKVFDELMLDADWSVNAGTWMWLSCSSFFQQFFHCYCPVRFGRKADPQGDFIRKYIPALKNIPTRYVHEPWVAPLDVQQTAGCIIGVHYPKPIVDHIKVSQINMERIKQVYTHLAKFKPQGALNPQIVQRPNVVQSSPSPTSIIRNINQSTYLCSQTPPALRASDKQNAPEYSNKNENVEQSKEIPFKELIIVRKNHSGNIKQASFDKQCLQSNQQYHCERLSGDKPEENIITYQKPNQDNYSFKNLIIHNYEEYSNSEVNYQAPQVSQSNLYREENSKLYYYTHIKQTFITPAYIENGTNLQEGYSQENLTSVGAAQLVHSNQEIEFVRPNLLEENTNDNCIYTTNSQTEHKGCESDKARENSSSNT